MITLSRLPTAERLRRVTIRGYRGGGWSSLRMFLDGFKAGKSREEIAVRVHLGQENEVFLG